MNLDILTSVFKQIDKIPSIVKTCIIVILFGILAINYTKISNKDIIKQFVINNEIREQIAEQHTFETASDINNCINNISKKDLLAYNVILLSYHNTQKSLQGYRYLYLDCLTECPKGLDQEPLKEFWHNLEYVYYENELSKIHSQEYLRISDIDSVKNVMPKIYKKLKVSGAKAAAFYTIEGKKSPIGMIVVLYKDPKTFKVGDYLNTMFQDIQKLAIILDYQHIEENVHD